MQLKFEEPYLGRGRGGGGAGVLTSIGCLRRERGRRRQGRAWGVVRGGVEVGGGVRGGVEVGGGGGVEVGGRGGVEGAESARRPTGDGGGESGESWIWGKWRGEGRTPWLSQK